MGQESDILKETLKEVFGFSQFRGEQESIVKSILGGQNTFVIMPTGAGKSLCYQLPAIVSEGTTIVISPLIALMKNQVDQLNGYGVKAYFLNSTLSKSEVQEVKKSVISGECKLLYIAPESLVKANNLEFLKKSKLTFVAVDEAHCISEWGHDFRPEYRKIKGIIENIDPQLPIIALTATATPKVQEDIQLNLGLDNANLFKTSFNRKNLFYEIKPKRADVNKQVIRFIRNHHGKSGIIYCLSRKTVEDITQLLEVNSIKVAPYHAGLEGDLRMKNQDAFLNEDVDVVVATIAFGMGIDKPDVRFVIHYDAPKSLEGYYQETGRAGRDGLEGHCLMFYAKEDIQKLEKFNKEKTATEKENAKTLLMEIESFANIGMCRRRQLLGYFGETLSTDCGMCDNCQKHTERFKSQDLPVMILQTVVDTKGEFDTKHIAEILSGYESHQSKSHKHEELDSFGAASEEETEVADIQSIIKQLVIRGYLEKDVESPAIIKITEKGRTFLADPSTLEFCKDHNYETDPDTENEDEENNAEGAGGAGFDEALFEMLKALRKKIAKEKNVPPYVVFQDPSLEEMANVYPTSKDELAQINGVGMGKVVKFGKPFLDLITKYVEDNEIETTKDMVVKSALNKSKIKIYIIQQIDRKIDLDKIAEAKDVSMVELISEIETICYSGTKLNLDYFIHQVIDEEKEDAIYAYFMSAESDKIQDALDHLASYNISEEELRLMRIKFLSEMAN